MEKITDNCDHCGQDTEITKETAHIANLTRCFGNFVLNRCTNCGEKTRLFVDESTQGQFERIGLSVSDIDQIPGPEFIESYLKVAEIPLPEEKELTPRQEDYVATRGLYLQSIDVTAEDFER
jgi:uncharacterized Zn finger protein